MRVAQVNAEDVGPVADPFAVEMGRSLAVSTGKIAQLAAGEVSVRQGDTEILVTACSAAPRPGNSCPSTNRPG